MQHSSSKKQLRKSYFSSLIYFFSSNWFQLLLLTVLVGVAYQNVLSYAFVIDDIGMVDMFKHLNQLVPFSKNPLESVRSFMYFVLYTTGHGAPYTFHLLSILFHIGNVWLIYLIISKMINKKVAFLTALLAAVHPIFVEAVTWISGSPYVEYSFFGLLSLFFYMNIGETKNTLKNKFYIFSLLSFLAATFMSEKSLVFPLLLVLYEFSFGDLKKNWKRFIPFFIITGLWIIFYIPKAQARVLNNAKEYHLQVGIENPLIQVPVAITSYFQLLFWPDKLSIYHSELKFSMTEIVIRFILLIIFFGTTVYFYRKNRTIFFWLGWFFVSLLPTMMPVRLSWIFAERYVYLGAMGIIAIFSLEIFRVFQYKQTRTIGALIVFALVNGLLIRTYVRNLDWRNEDYLWLATADASPSDFKTHNNVGTVYMKQGDIARAEREFIIAIAMNPHYADAHYNLGLLYMNNNVFDRAERNYILAIKDKPDYWQAYNGLTIVYLANRKFDRAEAFAKKTIQLKPDFPGGYNNLGLLYQVTGKRKEAIINFKKALSFDASLWQTDFNIALLYYLDNDLKNADHYLNEAKKYANDSSEFYDRLALVYQSMKKTTEAKQAISVALQINPNDTQAQQILQQIESQKN